MIYVSIRGEICVIVQPSGEYWFNCSVNGCVFERNAGTGHDDVCIVDMSTNGTASDDTSCTRFLCSFPFALSERTSVVDN